MPDEQPTDASQPRHRMPVWVRLLCVVGAVAVVVVILLLSGLLGEHGPGRHVSAGATGAATGLA